MLQTSFFSKNIDSPPWLFFIGVFSCFIEKTTAALASRDFYSSKDETFRILSKAVTRI